VTLIAAVRMGDKVLIGADSAQLSQESHTGAWNETITSKLRTLPANDVVWGWSGSSTIGNPVGWWLAQAEFPTWDSLAIQLESRVRELNTEARHQRVTGWETRVVAAGHIGNEIRIVMVDQTAFLHDRSDSALFEGTGAQAFKISWTHMSRYFSSTADDFSNLLDTTVRLVPGLSPPVQMWSVGKDDCQEIEAAG
jgi:hypothetical protein